MSRLSQLSWSVVLAVACGGTSEKDPSDPSEPVSDAPSEELAEDTAEPEIVDPPTGDYLSDAAADEPPVLDEAALSEAINGALVRAMALHGGPVTDAYMEMMAGMDSSCPSWGVSSGTPFWFDTCTSASGTRFDGYGYHTEYSGELYEGVAFHGLSIYTAARVDGADGSVFEGAGGASFLQGVNEAGQDIWSSHVQSGFVYDGAAAEGTWLADALDPDMSWYSVRDPAGMGAAAILSGAVALMDESFEAIAFDELLLIDAAWGSSCPIEPSGAISVLDSEGHWFDLYFHGQDWGAPPTPAELCDGCAEVWHAGTYLGEACADFSPLLVWDDYPFTE